MNADGTNVMREGMAAVVGAHLADEGGRGAEGGKADDRVGRRAARNDRAGAHGRIELLGAGLVDEGHRTLVQAFPREKVIVRPGDHVDNRIAEAEDIVLPVGHSKTPSAWETCALEAGAHVAPAREDVKVSDAGGRAGAG